jgi:hypothetical protein
MQPPKKGHPGCGGRTDRELMIGEWEPHQCATTEMPGRLSAATVAT